jgi:hypothetical protein
LSVISLLPVRSEAQPGTDLTFFSITHRDNSSPCELAVFAKRNQTAFSNFFAKRSQSAPFLLAFTNQTVDAQDASRTRSANNAPINPKTLSRVSESTRHCLANQLALINRTDQAVEWRHSQTAALTAPTNQSSGGTAKQLLLPAGQPAEQSHLPAKQLSHAHEVALRPVHARG